LASALSAKYSAAALGPPPSFRRPHGAIANAGDGTILPIRPFPLSGSLRSAAVWARQAASLGGKRLNFSD